MRKHFPEYFYINEHKKHRITNDSLIVLDTNILLDLYRYSFKTSNFILELLENKSKQIWMPNHVGKEFLDNRRSVINSRIEKLSDIKKKLIELNEELNFLSDHNSKQKSMDDSLCKIINNTQKKIEQYVKRFEKLLANDFILKKIEKIYKNKIGEPLSKEVEEEIRKIAPERYKKKVPPGYLDCKKDNGNEYGDLFIWTQIIEYAKMLKPEKQKKINVIFVCNEQKKDWWIYERGKKIGPRLELIRELREKTNLDFWLYTLERFVTLLTPSNNAIPKGVITEIQSTVIPKQIDKNPPSNSLKLPLDTSFSAVSKAINSLNDYNRSIAEQLQDFYPLIAGQLDPRVVLLDTAKKFTDFFKGSGLITDQRVDIQSESNDKE